METRPGRQPNISENLLDTYHVERHPVAARVSRNTMAQVALRRTDDRSKALSETVSELLAIDEPRRRLAGELSGLSVHYDLGEGHPLLGRRMPDLDLVTTNGVLRVYTLLHMRGRRSSIWASQADLDIAPWSDTVFRWWTAKCAGAWELPYSARSLDPPPSYPARRMRSLGRRDKANQD